MLQLIYLDLLMHAWRTGNLFCIDLLYQFYQGKDFWLLHY
uniref:Uncharacterized protein n=1 Tax=Podoviridae sp. ctsNK10 TaxID=2826582 RepID=A0A8S5NKR2_9CAUD|nr:MAG TPA: hypothetical protein [Podoviridae sp. ctsNK10]